MAKSEECEAEGCVQVDTIMRLESSIGIMDSTLTAVTGSLFDIKQSLRDIEEKIDTGSLQVEIKNGGGLMARMKLVDILQVTYDRPTTEEIVVIINNVLKESTKARETNFNRLVSIGKGITWIVGIIFILFVIFEKFHQVVGTIPINHP